MLQQFDKSRLDRAYEEAQRTDTEAVVVAIARDNGQVVMHNIGETDGRNVLYDMIASTRDIKLCDINARIELNKGGER